MVMDFCLWASLYLIACNFKIIKLHFPELCFNLWNKKQDFSIVIARKVKWEIHKLDLQVGHLIRYRTKNLNPENFLTFQSFNNFRQFASPTGFGYMFSKRIGVTRRLLWCLFIIVGLGYSLHNISESWKFYKTYPTTIKPAFTEEDKLKFPKSKFFMVTWLPLVA